MQTHITIHHPVQPTLTYHTHSSLTDDGDDFVTLRLGSAPLAPTPVAHRASRAVPPRVSRPSSARPIPSTVTRSRSDAPLRPGR